MERFKIVKETENKFHTTNLKDKLRNCIGRSTVTVYSVDVEDTKTGELLEGLLVRHFDSNIVLWIEEYNLFVLDYIYYDYSSSTGRVRNTFIRYILCKQTPFEYLSHEIPTLKQLRKIEKTTETITINKFNYLVDGYTEYHGYPQYTR